MSEAAAQELVIDASLADELERRRVHVHASLVAASTRVLP